MTATCAALALAVAWAPAAPAAASPVQEILNQCSSTGGLTRHYPVPQLEQALRAMSASQRQYTRCYDVIQQAITADRQRTGGAGGGGSGGSFLPTPVIVIIVLVILAAVTFGALAIRRRRSELPGDDDGPPDAGAG